MNRSGKPSIGVTLGDCAGIGPEIVDLALRSDQVPKSAEYKIIGKYPDCHPGQPTSALQQSEVVRVGLLLADFLQARTLSRGTSGSSTALSRQSSKVTMVARGGAARPRIAVAGLNPHAGESGKLGREEIEIIAPAVAELNQSLLTSHESHPVFTGPHSPDTVFHRAIE